MQSQKTSDRLSPECRDPCWVRAVPVSERIFYTHLEIGYFERFARFRDRSGILCWCRSRLVQHFTKVPAFDGLRFDHLTAEETLLQAIHHRFILFFNKLRQIPIRGRAMFSSSNHCLIWRRDSCSTRFPRIRSTSNRGCRRP